MTEPALHVVDPNTPPFSQTAPTADRGVGGAKELPASLVDRVVARAAQDLEEIVALAAELIRVPTVNPPGESYRECAEVLATALDGFGFETAISDAPPPTPDSPERCNLLAHRRWSEGPTVHLNGHLDVVPPGDGWTLDPFAGAIRDGRLYGRGAADMKAGLAAAAFAAELLQRAGVAPRGTVEVSGTADEESGGHAGVEHLARTGVLSARRIDAVIIPEPFGPDAICLGHRGVLWVEVTARGEVAHGSMPFQGRSAVEAMTLFARRLHEDLEPRLRERITAMPVEPPEARRPTLNINGIVGGQADDAVQSPCVADRCVLVLDRRYLPEEDLQAVRREIEELLEQTAVERPGIHFDTTDRLLVHPTVAPSEGPLVAALSSAIRSVRSREPSLVASPGTYDQKHFDRIAGIRQCVAYGPGRLEQAHQPDEHCWLDDLQDATAVLALTLAALLR